MNECKDCGTKLICVGQHPEQKDYRKWICPKCDKKKDKNKDKN